MKTRLVLALTLAVILSVSVSAQEKEKRFGFEISAGPSLATRNFADGLKTGFGYDGTIHIRLLAHAGVYGGWGHNWFSNSTGSSTTNRDYEETGYVLGLQFSHPVEGMHSSYFLRAGALYKHIEVENDNGDILADSGHGPGFQLAAGLNIDLGRSWSFTPVVKYNNLSRYLDTEGESIDIQYNYLTVRIGILKRF